MTAQPTSNLWAGRHDGAGAEHARWREIVRIEKQQAQGGETLAGDHLSLLGFPN